MLFDATHFHAEVLCGASYDDTLIGHSLSEELAHLSGESLLDLETASEIIDDTCQLGKADHLAIGYISDRNFAEEREDMMFTKGIELDILNDYHFRAGMFEDGLTSDRNRVDAITMSHVEHSLGGANGSFAQAFAIGVLADEAKDSLIMGGDFGYESRVMSGISSHNGE